MTQATTEPAFANASTGNASQASPRVRPAPGLRPDEVTGLVLRVLHTRAAASLPRTGQGQVYFLQAASYLDHMIEQIKCPNGVDTLLRGSLFGELSFNTRAVAAQSLCNERAALATLRDNRYHPHMGERINAIRADHGLAPIGWTTTSPYAGPATSP